MAFESLSDRLNGVFKRLRGKGKLSEADIKAAMQEVEDKTGIIKRFEAQRPHLDAVEAAAEQIRTINYRQFEDSRLTELADRITAEISALKD